MNILSLFKYPILREDYITTLISLKNELLNDKDNIYLLYSVLILEFTKKPIKNLSETYQNPRTSQNPTRTSQEPPRKPPRKHFETISKPPRNYPKPIRNLS